MKPFFVSKRFIVINSATFIVVTGGILNACNETSDTGKPEPDTSYWVAPGFNTEPVEDDENREQLLYGRELISNTSKYFGPNGSVAKISNGMNCQNCHLNAGTKPFGNNYGAVASTYPKISPPYTCPLFDFLTGNSIDSP